MKIICDGFEFNFSDAIDLFIFDEKDKKNFHYHGLSHSLKAVDLIVELSDYYLFIEIKDFFEPEKYQDSQPFNHLREILKEKYRDSWVYRWCEDKVDKPIKYLCLLELEKPLLTLMNKQLRQQIPVGKVGQRWQKEICNSCNVLNLEMWNQRFTAWNVIKLP